MFCLFVIFFVFVVLFCLFVFVDLMCQDGGGNAEPVAEDVGGAERMDGGEGPHVVSPHKQTNEQTHKQTKHKQTNKIHEQAQTNKQTNNQTNNQPTNHAAGGRGAEGEH